MLKSDALDISARSRRRGVWVASTALAKSDSRSGVSSLEEPDRLHTQLGPFGEFLLRDPGFEAKLP
jgi:hypothetical protein